MDSDLTIDDLMVGMTNAQLNTSFNTTQIKEINESESVKNLAELNHKSMYSNLYNMRIPLSNRIDTIRKKLLTPHANTTMQQEFLLNLFNRQVVLNKERNTHPHMMLAQIRRQFEFEVTLEMYPLKIVDIGAGTRSLNMGLSHVYNIQPVLSAADRLREIKRLRARRLDSFRSRWACSCSVTECKHIAHEPNQPGLVADVYLSIDSSYYDGVFEEICKLVTKHDKQAFLAFHAFDIANTGRHNLVVAGNTEGWYNLTRDTVEMQVFGNPCSYKHKIHPLNDLYYTSTCVKNGVFFAVIKCADFGTSKYLLVQAVPADPNINESGHDPSLLHSQLEKPILKEPNDKLLEVITTYDINAMKNGCYYEYKSSGATIYYRVVNTKLQAATIVDRELRRVDIASLNYQDLVSVVDLNRIVTKLLLKKGQVTYDDIIGSYVVLMAGKNIDLNALTSIIVTAVTQTKAVMERAVQIINSAELKQVNVYKTGEFDVALTLWQKLSYYLALVGRHISYYSFYLFLILAIVGTTAILSRPDFLMPYIEVLVQTVMALYVILCNLANTLMPFYVAASGGEVRQNGSVVVDLALGYLISLFSKPFVKYGWNFITQHYPRRAIQDTCITQDNYKEVKEPLMKGEYNGRPLTQWNCKIPANLSIDQFLDLNCGEKKQGLVQVMPEIEGAEEPIIYHVCPATNYCAAKRQVSVVPKPDFVVLNRFANWFERVFQCEVVPLLENTNISLDKWINHLSAKKQQPILEIEKILSSNLVTTDEELIRLFKFLGIKSSTDYEMFVKSEKQLYSEGKAPKNRCICSPNDLHKYVMGPVCWALEEQFKNFHGYCGGASWNDLEVQYDDWLARGFIYTIQLDGSGFDRTQHQVIKDIVDQKVYKYIADKVEHVPKDTFLRFAMSTERKVEVTSRLKLQKQTVCRGGFFKQVGAVFSGSCDTTLMNTFRMALYNRFVCEELCGMHWGIDYEVKSKGDDTVTVLRDHTNINYVLENYQRVFVYNQPTSAYPEIVHGLGQIAKYFKVGGLEDIDFCSTETVYCPRMGGFKILRQLKRFVTTTVWSRKAKNFTYDKMKLYLESLYQSNLTWMNGIPIYRVFNAYLHKNCEGLTLQTRTGKRKITREYEDILDMDFDYYHESDHKYTLHLNTYTRVPHELDMLEYFCRKYNWDPTTVYDIEQQLACMSGDWKIISPFLEGITH